MMWVEILNKRWIPCSADNAKRCSMDQCHLSATLASGSNCITEDYSKIRFKLFCHFWPASSPRSPDRVWWINYIIFCLSRDGGFILINSCDLIHDLTIKLTLNVFIGHFQDFSTVSYSFIPLNCTWKQFNVSLGYYFRHFNICQIWNTIPSMEDGCYHIFKT